MAARKPPLRAVGDDEKAPNKPAKTLTAAVDMSERTLLVTMRAKVAREIDAGVPSHALDKLMRQLREFDREIRALDAEAGKDGDDVGKAAATPDESWNETAI